MNTSLHYVPSKAIVIYQNSNSTHVQLHEITDGRLEAGTGLTLEEYDTLREMFKKKRKKPNKLFLSCNDFLQRTIVSMNIANERLYVAWIVPERTTTYYAKEKSFNTRFPQMVMTWNGKDLNVFAFKGKLNEKSKIYQMPYPNISSSGNVCLGNAQVRQYQSLNDIIRHVEELFYNTNFMGSYAFAKSVGDSKKFPYEKLKLYGNGKKLLNALLSD